jgi:hypothetical protein
MEEEMETIESRPRDEITKEVMNINMNEPTEAMSRRPIAYMSRGLVASIMSTLALAAGTTKSAESTPATSAGIGDCTTYVSSSRYHNHEYEVCTAYVANSAEIALQGFYKFGNNKISYLADAARHHFETRYWQGPRNHIERDVDAWPKTGRITGNKVTEDIDVVSVSSNLRADRGLVQSRESWSVKAPSGKILHREARHTKNITLCRGKQSGHLLHEWVVVKFSRDPKFDCIAFNKEHGITS